VIDPETGQVIPDSGGSIDDGTGGEGVPVAAVPVSTSAGAVSGAPLTILLIAGAVLLGAVLVPPLLAARGSKGGRA